MARALVSLSSIGSAAARPAAVIIDMPAAKMSQQARMIMAMARGMILRLTNWTTAAAASSVNSLEGATTVAVTVGDWNGLPFPADGSLSHEGMSSVEPIPRDASCEVFRNWGPDKSGTVETAVQLGHCAFCPSVPSGH